jgi:hypothetical protein
VSCAPPVARGLRGAHSRFTVLCASREVKVTQAQDDAATPAAAAHGQAGSRVLTRRDGASSSIHRGTARRRLDVSVSACASSAPYSRARLAGVLLRAAHRSLRHRRRPSAVHRALPEGARGCGDCCEPACQRRRGPARRRHDLLRFESSLASSPLARSARNGPLPRSCAGRRRAMTDLAPPACAEMLEIPRATRTLRGLSSRVDHGDALAGNRRAARVNHRCCGRRVDPQPALALCTRRHQAPWRVARFP